MNYRTISTISTDEPKLLYVLLAIAVSIVCLSIKASSFAISASLFFRLGAGIFLLIGSGMLLNRVGHTRIAGAIEAIAVFLAMSIGGMFASVVLASTSFPYTDDALIRADAMLGFHWLPVYEFFRSQPEWFRWASRIYGTLQWQPFLAIALLFACNLKERCWLFLSAWFFSLAVTLLIFPFFPALAGATYYGAGPVVTGPTPLTWVEVLDQSRSGALRLLDERSLVGLITFPSFHAASAALLGWAFAGIRYVRWPFVILNVAMALSAIVVGGHYLVDILGGVLIAWACIILAIKLRRTQSPARQCGTSLR